MLGHVVSNSLIKQAIIQACDELTSSKTIATRLYNMLALHGYIDINADKTDISIWSCISDETLLATDNFGIKTIECFRKTVDILNGVEQISKKQYTLTITTEEMKALRELYENKQREINILKRIISKCKVS